MVPQVPPGRVSKTIHKTTASQHWHLRELYIWTQSSYLSHGGNSTITHGPPVTGGLLSPCLTHICLASALPVFLICLLGSSLALSRLVDFFLQPRGVLISGSFLFHLWKWRSCSSHMTRASIFYFEVQWAFKLAKWSGKDLESGAERGWQLHWLCADARKPLSLFGLK